MSDLLERSLRLLLDIHDFSVLPILAKEINRNREFGLLQDIHYFCMCEINSEFLESLSQFYIKVFEEVTIHYPIIIVPGIKLDYTAPRCYRFNYNSYLDPDKRFKPLSLNKYQLAFLLPFNNPHIYPIVEDPSELIPLFDLHPQKLIENKFYVESKICTYHNSKVILRFSYPKNLWDFHIYNSVFFNHLFKGDIRIKGFNHERFNRPTDTATTTQ
jgi:hypothetical protein